MVLKTIYVARHGYRANWLPLPHPPNPTGVDSDPPLAKYGEKQAKELALFMLSIDPKPEIIFSSPFYRCLQTATPISDILDIPVELETGIGEWYKRDRPIVPEPASHEILSNFFPRLSNDWSPTVIPSKEGETEEQIFARCKEFIIKFIPKFEKAYPEIETVLFVSHAATKIAFGMALLGFQSVHDVLDEDDSRLRAGSCSLDQFDFDLDLDRWILKMNGNCEFLSGGEEMSWNFQSGFEAGSDEDIRARNAAAAKQKESAYQDFYVTLEIPPDSIGPIDKNFGLFTQNTSTNTPAKSRKLVTKSILSASLSSSKDASINISEYSNSRAIPPTSIFQSSGLETTEPYVKINDSIFKGEWTKLIGTEIIFDDQGEVVAKVKDHLCLRSGILKEKQVNMEEDEAFKKVNFLQKALQLAKETELKRSQRNTPDIDEPMPQA